MYTSYPYTCDSDMIKMSDLIIYIYIYIYIYIIYL